MHLVCPHCRNPVEVADPNLSDVVLCSACGSSFGIGGAGQSTVAAPQGAGTLGKFELLEGVGSGAFGTVYKARDRALDRTVAVKVPRTGSFSNKDEQERFLREARSVAQLRHPSIVSVYEVGQSEGTPYLVSEFVDGMTLADYLTGAKPTPKETAELVAKVAEALQYAHAHGIVHRDIKPSNIMLGADGTPHVMDFGLARRDAGEATMTTDGQVLGTPAYMSPEQAKGESHSVDGRADVYSLGVILYQLLTGELPFRGNTRMLLHQVLHDEPRPPRRINDLIPRDLETICLKSLAKETGRRYQSAGEFGDDLRRFLKNEPIHARPVGQLERSWRWCRRNPGTAGLISTIALLLVGSSIGGYWLAYREARAAENERTAKTAAQDAERRALASATEAANRQKEAEQAHESEHKAAQAANEAKAAAQASEKESRSRSIRLLTASGMAAASQGDSLGALPLLAEALRLDADDPAREEMHRRRLGTVLHEIPYLAQQLTISGSIAADLRSATPRFVTWNSGGNRAQVRNLRSGNAVGQPLVSPSGFRTAQFSPDGRWIATVHVDNAVRVWNSTTGLAVGAPLQHSLQVAGCAFSPDSERLATASADQTARVWAVETGQPVTEPLRHSSPVSSVQFSPDGKRVLSTDYQAARVWIAQSGAAMYSVPHAGTTVRTAELSRNGRHILVAKSPMTLQVCDAETGDPQGPAIKTEEVVAIAKFSPDGRWIAAGGTTILRLFDRESGAPIGAPMVQRDVIVDFVVSTDNRRISIACADGTVRVWNAATGRPASPPFPQDGFGNASARFTPDGDFLLTTGYGLLRLWDLTLPGEPGGPPGSGTGKPPLARGAQGTIAAYSVDTNSARVWNFAEGRFTSPRLEHQGPVSCADFSPDGQLVATGGSDNQARIWDVSKGAPATPVLPHDGPVNRISFSENGRCVITLSLDSERRENRTRVWDSANGKPITSWLPYNGSVLPLPLVSPDGRFVVAFHEPRHLQILEAATGRPVAEPLEGLLPAFNLKGTRFAYSDYNTGSVQLLETERWHSVGELVQRPGYASREFEFSRKLDRLVTIDETPQGLGLVLVWDAITGARIAAIENAEDFSMFRNVGFSPDGRRVVAADNRNSIQVWDAGTGSPLTAAVPLSQQIVRVSFSGDGRRVITLCGAYAGRQLLQEWDAVTGEPVTCPRQWSEDPAPRPSLETKPARGPLDSLTASLSIDELSLLTRLLAMRHVGGRGGLVNVSPVEADRLWQQFTSAYPTAFFRSDKAESARQAAKLRTEQSQAATAAESAGRIPEAIAAISRLIELGDDDPALYLRRANLFVRERQWDDAEADFDKAEKLGSTFDVWTFRGRAHLSRGQPERAIAESDKVLAAGSAAQGWLTAAHALRGQSFAELGKWSEAARAFDQAVQLSPLTILYWEWQVLCELAAGDAPAWRETCRRAFQRLSDQKNDYVLDRLVSLCTMAPDSGVDAGVLIALAEQRVASQPENFQYVRTLAAALYRGGKFDRALRRLLELGGPLRNTGDPIVVLYLALAHHRLGHTAEAQIWLETAARLVAPLDEPARSNQPKPSWMYRLPIQTLYRDALREVPRHAEWTESARAAAEAEMAGRISDAIAAAGRLIELNQQDSALCLRRALLRSRLQQWTDADADLNKAEELGETVSVWNARALNSLARGEPERALTECAPVLNEKADPYALIQARQTRGMALADLQRWSEARTEFTRASELASQSIIYREWKALVEQAGGDLAAWRETCAALVAWLPDLKQDWQIDRVVVICTRGPDSGVDAKALVKIAEQQVAKGPANTRHAQYLRNLGAALYRAGDFEAAVRRLLEAAGPQQAIGESDAMLFLAMSHQRLGHSEEARAWFAKAEMSIKATQRTAIPDQLLTALAYRLAVDLLHREAKALFDESK